MNQPGRGLGETALLAGLPSQLGAYRLLGKIGHGGMGDVFRAEHVHLKQTVALKLLPASRSDDPQAVQRFYKEMAAIGKLDDPRIVKAHDAGEANGFHFLTMEFVDGIDVGRVQKTLGCLSVPDACEIARQAAEGLDYISRHGLVHRDIKPSNLMLTSQGQIKLLDLGLARFAGLPGDTPELTSTGQILGTVDYLAPEQIVDSREVDIRADIYALGCTLYQLLTGHAPFSAPRYSNTPSKLMAHCHEAPSPVGGRRPDVPAELTTILEGMLAKTPDERFQTPAELALALAPLASASDLPTIARRVRGTTDTAKGDPSLTSTIAAARLDDTVDATLPGAKVGRSSQKRRRILVWLCAGLLAVVMSTLLIGGRSLVDRNPHASTRRNADSVPKPHPEPKSPPAAANLDDLPPLQWHHLLEQSPGEVFWARGDGLSNWQYQPELEQVTLQCSGMGALELGRTNRPDYRLQFGIHQVRWTGGVGVFWGMHPSATEEGPCTSYQFLDFRCNPAAGRAPQFNVTRGLIRMTRHESGVPTFDSYTFSSGRIPFPEGEQTIEIVIHDSLLGQVSLNGTDLGSVIEVYGNVVPTAEDSLGGFGVLVNRSNCIVRSAKYMALDAYR